MRKSTCKRHGLPFDSLIHLSNFSSLASGENMSRQVLVALCGLLFCVSAFAQQARFWVWDLTVMPPGFRQPVFELYSSDKLSTDNVHVWVEKELGAHTPTPTALDYLRLRATTMIELQRDTFGLQPISPSGSRDFNILITALPPYEKNGKKFGFDGFFNIFDQLTEPEAQKLGQHSNELNVVYVNALHDVSTPYMHGVLSHELNHLITHGQYDEQANPLDPWLNEMLGEAAMQMTGHFTDLGHVERYRQNPEWPLAVNGYGISYGATSLFGEFLIVSYGHKPVGKIAPAQGSAFARLESVYKTAWSELFARYVAWLYEQTPRSQFGSSRVVTREPADEHYVGATGVVFLTDLALTAEDFRVTAAPAACTGSRNVVRSTVLTHVGENGETRANAVWVESTPPCAAERGGQGFEKDAFKLVRAAKSGEI